MSYGVDQLFQDKKDTKFLMTDIIREGESLNYKYHIILPDFLHEWDIRDYWEKERIASMQANLKKGETLFDIGAESGYMSAIFATMVGPENMVMFEPSEVFWPDIKAIWEANDYATPKDTFWGFVGAETKNINTSEDCDIIDGWPRPAHSDKLIKASSYRYLWEPTHEKTIQQITIDDYVGLKGIIPDALTMDCEGAEMAILKGAEQTLKKHKPKVWVSEHFDDLQLKHYGVEQGTIRNFMEQLGYTGELLATDHEQHWLYL